MTARRRLSTRDRAIIFGRENGVCHMCSLRIEAGQAWEASHRIPLACGGADDLSNLSPAHKKCHREHTAKIDAPWIAKTRRQRQKHMGAKQPSGMIRSPGFPNIERVPKRLSPSKIANGIPPIARMCMKEDAQ